MKRKPPRGRRLRLEMLESRQMMAVFTVDDSFTADNPAARQFNTIQEAVTAAVAGDTIKVRPGTYEENVVVNKQLTIEGADPKARHYLDPSRASIVDPVNNTATGGLGVGFDLQANGIVIEGFTIGEFDGAADADGTIGIRTSASFSGYTIEDNVLENNTIGVHLNTATTASAALTVIEDNIIVGNERAGANTGNGIFSNLGLRNVVIEDNRFSGDNDTTGIRIVGTAGTTPTVQSGIIIEDNKFRDMTGGGIYLERVVDSVIEDNDFENLRRNGIQLNGLNQRVTIEDNDLENPGTAGFHGIILSDDADLGANQNNIIEDNEIEDAGLSGLVIRDSASNTIEDNKIKRSRVFGTTDATRGNGISLQNADNNTLDGNKVKQNARHGVFIDADSTGNSLISNKSKDNNTSSSASTFDYNDATTGGTGPSGSRNTFQRNKGRTQNKTGLIQQFV